MERFITDDIAIKEGSIDHFAIIESGYGNHHRMERIGITLGRNVTLGNAKVRKRVMLVLQVKQHLPGQKETLFARCSPDDVTQSPAQQKIAGPEGRWYPVPMF